MKSDQAPDHPEVESLDTEELVTLHFKSEAVSEIDIHLSMEAYQAIAAHAVSDLNREVIGLLLGQVSREGDRLQVSVVQALKGQETLSTSASVQLSYESWKHFIEEKAARYTHLATVGWYHTHPGLGTFLSDRDEFIHQNFFGKFWQVALVVDPIREHWTFFRHQAGGTERCEKFMLIVPDNSSPNSGARWRERQPLRGRKRRDRSLLGGLFRNLQTGRLPGLGKSGSETLISAPTLGLDDCQRLASWFDSPLHVAVAGPWVYWTPSSRLLKFATGEYESAEFPLSQHVDALAPSPDGMALYLLALDRPEVWLFRPDATPALRSFQVESEEEDDIEIDEYEVDLWSDRCRLACLDDRRLVVCTARELVVLALNDETDEYQVAYRRRLARMAFLGARPMRPLLLVKDMGVVMPDLMGDRLVCYSPLGEQDDHITVQGYPLRSVSDVVLANQQLVILDSAKERILVSNLQGQLLRQFRLDYDFGQRLRGLLGTTEAAYLVLSDGVWRCDRLLDGGV